MKNGVNEKSLFQYLPFGQGPGRNISILKVWLMSMLEGLEIEKLKSECNPHGLAKTVIFTLPPYTSSTQANL